MGFCENYYTCFMDCYKEISQPVYVPKLRWNESRRVQHPVKYTEETAVYTKDMHCLPDAYFKVLNDVLGNVATYTECIHV